jgi:hypothetical protein
MLALALDLWQPAIIGGAGRAQWLANFAKRFGGVTPGVYVDFTTRQAYQAGQPSVLTPDNALTCACASTRYRDDSLGNWNSFAPNTLAYTNKGLRVWEARTNAIRNNSMQGAVVGTPGTLPINWLVSGSSGINTPNVVGFGTDQGIDYIDLQYSGTAVSGSANLQFDTNTAIPVANGQTWTASVFYKLVGGSLSNVGAIPLYVIGYNSSQVFTETPSANIATPTGIWQRAAFTTTYANAATVTGTNLLQFSTVAGPINFTLRIGWPQLEQMPFATPPIRTTNAAVTEAAEVVTLTNPPVFGSAYSMYAAGAPYGLSTNGGQNTLTIINDAPASGNNRLQLGWPGSPWAQAVFSAGGVNIWVPAISTAWGAGIAKKLAAAFASADHGFAAAGSVLADTAAGIPTGLSYTTIGSILGSGFSWDGDITEFAIWPTTRIPNASLISGTQ